MATSPLHRSLQGQYIVALALVALLSVASFGVLTWVMSAQEADAPTINVSGRQRMLSQRVSLMALRYMTAHTPQERVEAREQLEGAIELMASSHAGLVDGSEALGIRAGKSDTVAALYFEPTELDARVLAYLDDARGLLALPESELVASHPVLVSMLARSQKPLLRDLNEAVKAYETEGSGRVSLLQRSQLGLLLVTLLLLVAEGAFLFRPMVMRIVALVDEMRSKQRMIEEREQSLRLVLDSMAEALIPIDADGGVRTGYSARLEEWFGAPSLGTPIWDLLLGHDERTRVQMHLGFSQLQDGFLPEELLIDQLPKGFQRDWQHFSLRYKRIDADAGGFLVTVSDVTATVHAERERAEALEVQEILLKTLQQRNNYDAFVEDTDRLLLRAGKARTLPDLLRALHTMKGNTAIFGFRRLSSLVHKVEDELLTESSADWAPLLDDIRTRWQSDLDRIAEFVDTNDEDGIWLETDEVSAHLRAVVEDTPKEDLVRVIQRWRLEPAVRRLKMLGASAERIGAGLGKRITVDVGGNYLRLPSKRFNALWSELVHLVRNAVDHGIESPEVREAAGKQPEGAISLATRMERDAIAIEVADDGSGVDVERLRAKAEGMGIDYDPARPLDLVFADGLSSRDRANPLSGRGVGMSAVKRAIDELGATVSVWTSPGEGTRFTILVPLSEIPELEVVREAA